MYRRMSWGGGGAVCHLGGGRHVARRQETRVFTRLSPVPSPAQYLGPLGPQDTHHVKHVGHEHLHIHH